MSVVEFDGQPFDPLAWSRVEPVRRPGGAAAFARALRMATLDAHRSALGAQERLQSLTLARLAVPAPAVLDPVKPLARTTVTRLDSGQLRRLGAGDVAGVFGPAYDQEGANPDIRLGAGEPVVLTSAELSAHGVTVTWDRAASATPVPVAVQAAQVFALFLGLHLCLADAVFAGPAEPVVSVTDRRLTLRLVAADLVPRPWVRMRVPGGAELTVGVREKPGTPVGPLRGGRIPARLGRKGAVLSEFHLAHLSRGDVRVALGPEFADPAGGKAPRLPDGDLLFVDRVVRILGRRGTPGGVCETEYHSPADAWYYADTANDSMPHLGYLEMSLQAALFTGSYLGPAPSGVTARNLGGSATVLREVDLRDKTVRQRSDLLSTTDLPGAALHSIAYTLFADDVPFYRGETMFGYFGEEVLAGQRGSAEPAGAGPRGPVSHRIDLREARRDSSLLCSRGRLALLDQVEVADGGWYGEGCLRAVSRIDPGDWFFARHFRDDPVMPGSFGVEAVIQAMQAWLAGSDQAAGLREPGFVVPAGLPFRWRFRGQVLPADGEYTLEAHLKEIRRGPGRVRAVADAWLWTPARPVSELTDVAVELRERGAPPW